MTQHQRDRLHKLMERAELSKEERAEMNALMDLYNEEEEQKDQSLRNAALLAALGDHDSPNDSAW